MFAKKQIPHQLVMTSARWQAIVKIFEDALEKPQGDQDAFVREACAGDPDIEAEVARLLTADEDAGSFLEGPILSTLPPRSTLNRKPTVLASGSLVSGRFEVVRFIGQGGMGQVYEALDLELKAKVALKAIREDISSDPQMLARFRREVLLTRRITHPNVCRTFDIERHSSIAADGTNSDMTFLTMELLEGETLAELLRRQGRLATTEALPLVLQMIEALSAAHNVGIVHRDFKPSNVLLVPINNGLRVVVTDFGLARAILPDSELSGGQAATSLTGSQGLMGTLVYMAPEQFERGEASVASDIYSLGLVMFEMVTGRRPFADDIPFAEATKRLKQLPPSPAAQVPDIAPAWDQVIPRCLALNPKDRFDRAQQIAEALIEPNRVGAPSRVRDSRPTNRKLLAAAGIIVLLVSLSVGIVRLIKWRSLSAHLNAGSNVLVTEIENVTGDQDLTGTAELLRNELSQSTYVNLLEPSRVKEALERMSQPRDMILEPKLAREVAWREGVPLVIFGTVSRVAEDYRLDLKAEKVGSDPSYPKNSWRFSETASSKQDLFEVVQHGGTWVRHLVGEADDQIENADRKLEDVTTGSWEALKLYSDGQRLASLDRLDEAALVFKRATDKDPDFAMAWMRLGDTLDTIGKAGEGFSYWRKAIAVSGDRRLSPREELRIKGMYASDTGDLKAAIDYFGQYSIAYPNDYLGYFYRGVPLMLLGRTEEAIQVLHEAEKRAPESYYIADHLAHYNLILGNFSEVARYTARVRQLGHPWWADEIDGLASAMQGDFDHAEKLFEGLAKADDPFLVSVRFYLQASVLAEQGHYDEAVSILNKGIETDLPKGDAAFRADKLLGLAYLYWKKGDRAASREAALKSFEAEPSVRRTADIGSLLARAGFVFDAQRLLNRLDPKDSMVVTQIARLRLEGEILLTKGLCQRAVAELQEAKDEDQEQAMLRDYWGHALSACGYQEEAVAEFDRLRSRPGQVWHQADSYMPGLNGDLLFESAAIRYRLHSPDAKAQLLDYLARRKGSQFPQVLEAEMMYRELDRPEK
jgi:serine/threonine protein kinase/tetratricopeptide (TPR) repeat protein